MKKLLTYSLVVATMVWSLGIAAVVPASAATPADGSVIKVKGGVDIYYVEGGQKHRFLNPTVLKSWYFKSDAASSAGVDFAKVALKEVAAEDFNALPTGSDVTVRPGSFLIQFGLATAIYTVGPNAELYKVDSPATAVKLFGANWGKKVVVFPSNYNNVNRYGPVAGTLTSASKLPDGMIVKFTGDDKTYVITGGQKKVVTAEGFIANSLNAAFVKTATNPSDYVTATGSITGVDAILSTRAITADMPTAVGALTVSLSSNTPVSKSVPGTVSRAPFTKVNLTASSAGSVNIESMVVKRSGLTGAYSQIAKVWAEKDGVMVASKRTLSSNDEAILTFAPALTIPAGQTISVDIIAELTAATGNAALGVTSVNGNAVSVTGNLMSFVDYNVTRLTVVTTSPAHTLSVGEEVVELGKFEVNFTSNTRDVVLNSVALRNTQAEDLKTSLMNVYLEKGGERVSANGVIDGRYITFAFNSGYTMLKDDGNATFTIKGDVIGRNTTGVIDLRLNKKEDLVAYEKATGFGVTLGHADDMVISTIQVNSGVVSVSKKATSPSATTVVKGTSNLVALLANVKADEAINADAIKVKYSASDLTSFSNVKIYVNNVLLGSFDPSTTTALTTETIDSSLTLNKGNNEIKVTVDVRSNASSTATFSAQIVGTGSALLTTPEYVSNGNAVSANDISGTATGADITVQAGTLSVTRNDGYALNRPYIKGSTDVSLGKFAFKATNDAVKLTSISLGANTGATSTGVLTLVDSSISDMKLFVDGVQLGTTRNFASGATFSSLNYTIAKDVTKIIELKGSFDTSATGTFKTLLTVNAQDSVGRALTAQTENTQQVLVEEEGTLSVVLSPSTPSSGILIAPTTVGAEVAKFKLTAIKDAASITELVLTNYGTTTPTSTTSADPRISSYDLYVGTTLIGSEVPVTGVATFILASNKLVVPANDSVDLIVKANLNGIELASESNKPVSLGISGVKAKASNGADLASGSITVTSTKSNIMAIRKGMPVISKVSGISSSQGAVQQLGEFKIDAVNEDIELTSLTVSLSGTGSASTSDFILQEVGRSTDLASNATGTFSGFSTIISKGTPKTYRVFANTNDVVDTKTFGITISASASTNNIRWNEYFVAGFAGNYDASLILSSSIDFGTMKY